MLQSTENIFQYFCSLSRKVQMIDRHLHKEQIDLKARVAYHKKLESLQNELDMLKEQTISMRDDSRAMQNRQTAIHSQPIFSQMEQLERQVIRLYKEVEERFEQHKISLISHEAMEMADSLIKGEIGDKMEKLPPLVESLWKNILSVFQERRPSISHRKIIQIIVKLINQVEILISGKQYVHEQMRQTQLLKKLLKEAIDATHRKISPEEATLAAELYEIADIFKKRKTHEGNIRLKSLFSYRLKELSNGQKNRLESIQHLDQELSIALREIASGDPCLEWEVPAQIESLLCVLQAQ